MAEDKKPDKDWHKRWQSLAAKRLTEFSAGQISSKMAPGLSDAQMCDLLSVKLRNLANDVQQAIYYRPEKKYIQRTLSRVFYSYAGEIEGLVQEIKKRYSL